MKIQIKHNGKIYFIQQKKPRQQPHITPFRGRAWDFDSLNACKNVRDDTLEYFKNAVIVA